MYTNNNFSDNYYSRESGNKIKDHHSVNPGVGAQARNHGGGLAHMDHGSYALPPGYSPQVVSNSASKLNKFSGYHSTMVSAPVQPPPAVQQAPRSAAEETFDSSSKFRQLPCRTFISVGTCPYRERCVYLHDPRCVYKDAKTKTRKKNKEDMMPDALFWPVMPYEMVASKLDVNQQPHVIQNYQVPYPQSNQYYKHDCALYSMWMHFVDSCVANNTTADAVSAGLKSYECYSAPDIPMNPHTYRMRLPIFMLLSKANGVHITAEDVLNCHITCTPNKMGAKETSAATSVASGTTTVSSRQDKEFSGEDLEKTMQLARAAAAATAAAGSSNGEDMGASSSSGTNYMDLFRPINSESKGWDHKESHGAGSESKTISPSRTTQSSYSSKASTPRSSFDGYMSQRFDPHFDQAQGHHHDHGGHRGHGGSVDPHDCGSTMENHSHGEWVSEVSTGGGLRRDREGSIDTLDSLVGKYQDMLETEAGAGTHDHGSTSQAQAHMRVSPTTVQFSPSHGSRGNGTAKEWLPMQEEQGGHSHSHSSFPYMNTTK